jgi:phospholipid/cholesterol/gamma-HCH transport system substrate-binding protein
VNRASATVRWRKRVGAIGAALALGVTLTSCVGSGGVPNTTATAIFSDVDDLVSGAQVQMADIPVGHVTGISLVGDRAKVTMTILGNTRVPANVTAALQQSTILGDRFINLEVPAADIAHPEGVKLLANGAQITRTTVTADVEQLVQAGAQVFGAVSSSDLAEIIQAGAQGFVGQNAAFHELLNDLSAVTAGYAQRTADIQSVIENLDQLGTSLAPDASSDAQALTNLSQTVAILAQESTQFNNLLTSLNTLSVEGRDILETYYPQINDQLHALADVAEQLGEHQSDLAGLLENLPLHNENVPDAVRNDYVQLLENLIVCGVPGLGENSTPAFTCEPNGSGS